MKRHKTVIISAWLLVTVLLSLVGCNGGGEPTGTPSSSPSSSSSTSGTAATSDSSGTTATSATTATSTTTQAQKKPDPTRVPECADREVALVGETVEKVKRLGRTDIADDGIICDHSGTGISFYVFAKGEVTLTLDVSGSTCYFSVYVDSFFSPLDTRFSVEAGADRTLSFRVSEDSQEVALHEIKIVKQNQSQRNTATFKKLSYYGDLIEAPSLNERRYIEFIGDSITCGHGNLVDSSDPSGGSSDAEDVTQAYSYLTADKLGADYSIISYSGIGVRKGWSGDGEGNYLRINDFYKTASWARDKSKAFDFSNARIPDVVVINMGTNDVTFENDKPTANQEAEFNEGVRELVSTVRSAYGKDVPIVWAYGMMNHANNQRVKTVFAELGGENAGLYTLALPHNNAGGQSHPTVEGHEAASDVLAAFIMDEIF